MTSENPLNDASPSGILAAEPAVDAVGLRKVYGPTTALAGVDFQVRAGEIHGLLGENGAGKSTLVRLLAGVERPDDGELRFFGEPASGGPGERRGAGLAFIHQDLGLFPEFSVADTIALSSGYVRRAGLIDESASVAAAQAVVDRLGFACDVTRPVGELPLADQTLVAVCRALAHGARLIVLDEPTAYLEARQARKLFDLLAGLRADGVACVLITHRSEDVLRVCDRVTVLRDGRTVAVRTAEELSETELIRLITGRGDASARAVRRAGARSARSVRLAVEELRGRGFGPVSLTLHEGEVLGLCGLADAGQFAVGRTLVGDMPLVGGTLTLDGRPYRPSGVRAALAAGIGFVPADRAADGLAASLTAAENMLMSPPGPWWRPLRGKADESTCRRLLETFRVSPPLADRDVSTFSGGNQQKILLAKWLGFDRRLIILNEPSAGVDVGAKADIHEEIRSECETKGTAALVITTDFQEMVDLCDRALIMRRGQVVGELDESRLHADLLTEMAYGGTV
ncbi:sugar ABC transporter ATP-binding protein [Streptomyces sp. NPDC054770]